MRLSIIAVLAVIGGCSYAGPKVQIENWPKLKIVEHYVSQREMRDACVPYAPVGYSPEACALFKFDKRECHIYVSKDFPDEGILQYERDNCNGITRPYWKQELEKIRDRFNRQT